ncbi:uncharacterized protein LOC128954387 [Oppia nitens]|uniref:uncharacterized protein LOC128954387 n=1 Tax=Oppia nitens TaxID=1686743 RepID=UPI0023DB6FA6|nr:uncharacterized protein LOC128954387 [Oppia nitens]
MTTAMKDSFDRFGDDLCQLLLTNLPIKDRLILQSVSKQWLALIFNTQTHLVFNKKLLNKMSLDSMSDYYQTIKLFHVLVRKCRNITAVTINVGSILPGAVHMMSRFINLLIKYSHRLRHISIKLDYDGLWSVIDRTFERFFWRFGQQLLTFKFQGYNYQFNKQLFYEVVDAMPNLKTLDINCKHPFNPESTVQLDDIFIGNNMCYLLPESLQSLNIKLAETSLPLFANFADIFGHQLISLTIQFDDLVVNDDNDDGDEVWTANLKPLSAGFRQMPRLRQLNFDLPIDFGADFSVDLFSTIGRNCRQLRSLDYKSYFGNILKIKAIFVAINKHMSKQLQRLSLEWMCNNVDDNEDLEELSLTSDSLNRLHGLTHLTLRLYDWDIIGEQFFQDIHLNLPRLQSIHCDNAPITEKSVQSIGQLAQLMDVCILSDSKYTAIKKSYIFNHLLIDTKAKHLYLQYKDSVRVRQRMFKCGKYLNKDYSNYNINDKNIDDSDDDISSGIDVIINSYNYTLYDSDDDYQINTIIL